MYIRWNREKLEKFLKDKQMRSVDIEEYLLLIEFINKIRPDTIIDIGTYLGSSGYILSTCCDSIKYSYSIENTYSEEYYPKEEAERMEHGKYLQKETIFLTNGYDNGVLDGILKEHPNAFIFWDAGKNTYKVMRQIVLSYKNKVKYIAFHDSGNVQRGVRRAIKRVEKLDWYKTIEEDVESCPGKGISILELIHKCE